MQDLRGSVERALGALEGVLGERPGLDANGVIAMELAGDVVCSLEVPRDGDHVYLHAPVLRLPVGSDATDLLERALVRNAFGLTMPTAWLALDSETRSILVCVGVQADRLSGDGFMALLADLQREVLEARAALGPKAPNVTNSTMATGSGFMVRI